MQREAQLIAVILLMGVLPAASILIEYFFFPGASLIALVGKWFVFWGVGGRLALAGVKQITDPAFTAEKIFRITDKNAEKLVSEIGFGNIAIGALALLTIFNPAWITPAAFAGFLFYALAGGKHVFNANRTGPENVALWSDLAMAAVLAVYLAATFLGR